MIRCTTTRVAERAGMSVGSLYQYYPNRDALLAAVLQKHLEWVAEAVELACGRHQGRPVAEMACGLVSALVTAKLRDQGISKALYAIAGERGGAELVARINKRMVAVIAAMLETAPDAHFEDPILTAGISLSAIVGPVRTLLEGNASPAFEPDLSSRPRCCYGAICKPISTRFQTRNKANARAQGITIVGDKPGGRSPAVQVCA
nr:MULTISPECIES: TetR/AcrR family transcriptional regulator [unclassified Pseudomonas]